MREMSTRKSMVNESEVEYATHSVNHVLGCTHGCAYCYAFNLDRRFGRTTSREDWEDPQLSVNALDIVEREMRGIKGERVERVHLSFMTDPFMFDAGTGRGVPEIEEMSIAIIRRINDAGIPVNVLTKGVYPDRLLEELPSLSESNQYGITVTSVNMEYVSEWEPRSARPDQRIRGLERLVEAGGRGWVSLEPYPTPNIDSSAEGIDLLLDRLHAFEKLVFGKMNYVPMAEQYHKEHPEYYERVARRFLDWCQEHEKSYHIKEGTPLHSGDTCDFMAS